MTMTTTLFKQWWLWQDKDNDIEMKKSNTYNDDNKETREWHSIADDGQQQWHNHQ